MRFKLEMNCDNDAFADDLSGEVIAILTGVQQQIMLGDSEGICRDVNGNTVGRWEITEADADDEDTGARHTSCKHCDLNIEGLAPYPAGEWRDRGNNTTCPTGATKHEPYEPQQ